MSSGTLERTLKLLGSVTQLVMGGKRDFGLVCDHLQAIVSWRADGPRFKNYDEIFALAPFFPGLAAALAALNLNETRVYAKAEVRALIDAFPRCFSYERETPKGMRRAPLTAIRAMAVTNSRDRRHSSCGMVGFRPADFPVSYKVLADLGIPIKTFKKNSSDENGLPILPVHIDKNVPQGSVIELSPGVSPTWVVVQNDDMNIHFALDVDAEL